MGPRLAQRDIICSNPLVMFEGCDEGTGNHIFDFEPEGEATLDLQRDQLSCFRTQLSKNTSKNADCNACHHRHYCHYLGQLPLALLLPVTMTMTCSHTVFYERFVLKQLR